MRTVKCNAGESLQSRKDAAVDLGCLVSPAENLDEGEGEFHGGPGGLAGDNGPVDDNTLIGNSLRACGDFWPDTWMTGGGAAFQDTVCGENAGCGAYCGDMAMFCLQGLNNLFDPWIITQVVGAGLAARQDDHVEILGMNVIERTIRNMPGFARSFDGTGLSSRHDHIHPGAPQDINHSDGFDFLEAGRERHEDFLHCECGALGNWLVDMGGPGGVESVGIP